MGVRFSQGSGSARSPSASRGSRGLLALPGMDDAATAATTTTSSTLFEGLEETANEDVTEGSLTSNASGVGPRSARPPAGTAEREAEEAEQRLSKQHTDQVESVLGLSSRGRQQTSPRNFGESAHLSSVSSSSASASSGSATDVSIAPRRKDVLPTHSILDKEMLVKKSVQDSALAIEALKQNGGKAAPEAGLGSFMFVKNSRFDPSRPTPDNPRFWVGRVAEIMRGGKIRLHWHRETSLGSGSYTPTNNYFPERQGLLKNFAAAVLDPASREWRVHPALESGLDAAAEKAVDGTKSTNAAEGLDAKASSAANVANAVLVDSSSISAGSFVFLRNARFKPESESPLLPRYWVARVTTATTPETAKQPSSSLAANASSPALPDGRLRLQWHRESALGSNIFSSTNHFFYEHQRLVKPLPGPMRFDASVGTWKRSIASLTEAALCFPGDEAAVAEGLRVRAIKEKEAQAAVSLAAAAAATRESETALAASKASNNQSTPGAVVSVAVPPIPLEEGVFGFVPNAKYKAGTPETPTAPRFWVARVLGVTPRTNDSKAKIRVQWHQEVSPGSGLYRQTPKTFNESFATLRPLSGVVFDRTVSSWRLTGAFNDLGRFEEV